MTQTKSYSALTKFAILSIIIAEYTIALTTPALGAVAKAFPNVSMEMIKMVQSLPNLFMIIVALLTPLLEKKFSKKTLLLSAMVVMFISGIASYFTPAGNFTYLLIMRALFGCGRGICFPYAMGFVAELFDGAEKEKMMGWDNGLGNLTGLVLTLLGGYLANFAWNTQFLGFLVIIPVFLLVWLKCPDPSKVVKPVENSASEVNKSKDRLTVTTWAVVIFNCIAMIFIYSYITSVALVITEQNLGEPSVVGAVMATFLILGAISGLFYGTLFKRILKRYTDVFGLLLVGLAMVFLIRQNTIEMFYVGSAIFGIGFSTYNSDQFINVSVSSAQHLGTQALAMFMAFSGVGQFASPLILSAMASIAGITKNALADWTVSGPACIIMAVALGIYKILSHSKYQTHAKNQTA